MRLPDDYRWLLGAGALLGLAVAINHGRWADLAFAAVVPAFLIVAWRLWVAVRDRGVARAKTLRVAPYLVLGLLAALPIIALCDGTIIPKPAVTHWLVGRAAQVMFLGLLATYLPFLTGRRVESERMKSARFVGFALLVCVAGLDVIRVSPVPDIDVWTVQKEGAEALLAGKNPYVVVAVPDTDPETDFTVPYCYPPFPIYMGSIALAARGDIRHPLLVALLVAGFAMRFIARRRRRDAPASSSSPPLLPSLFEDAPALFFWLAPPLFMVLDRSWIDPFQIVLITLGVAAFVDGRKTLAAVLLGVAVTSKQSMFFVFPLAAIVLGLDLRRCIVMGVAALLPVLPFLAWDFRRLKYANFDFMNGLGARHDGLCFSTWVYNTFHATFPPQITFVASAAVVAAACLRRPTPGDVRARYAPLGFARALLVTYFVFFFFNRWAFANYYFLLIGFASLAAATAVETLRSSSSDDAPAA